MPTPPEARVAEHCRRHALMPAGLPVLALVSGGPDSICMMHLLARLHDGPVGVLTVDHGLRAASAAEADAVVEAAEELGLRAHRVDLRLEPGPGAPARARRARWHAARRVAAEGGYARIATGHTASDQAETVLFRLARGAGRAGALGMAPRDGDVVRPLLCLEASETRAWCAAAGLGVADDPSNADPAYARTRVREGLVPALRAVHPAATRHLTAFAELLRDEAALLEPLVDAGWARCARGEGLAAEALAAEPEPLRRLLARRLVAAAGLPGEALASASLARVLAAAGGDGPQNLPGGGRAALERAVLVVTGPPGPPPAAAGLDVPGRALFGAVAIRAWRGPAGPPEDARVAVTCEGPLRVRPPAPGDRLPLPGGGHVAVGRLLADRGVPSRARAGVPVVECGGRVVWVAGHRAAGDLLAAAGTSSIVLQMEAG